MSTRGSNSNPFAKGGAVQEAVARYHGGTKLQADFVRIAERRGKHRARIAVARKLLRLVYFGLSDGEIRCLAKAA